MWTNEKEWKRKADAREIKIGVMGGGYVGLNLSGVLVKNGFHVTVYDIDENKVKLLNERKNYIIDEEWLNQTIEKAVEEGLLKASTEVHDATNNDVIFIDVPTAKGENYNPTPEFIINVSETIGKTLKKGTLVIVESSVIVGYTEDIIKPILEKKSGLKAGEDFGLVFSPERVDPGNKKNMIWNTPKIVGGVDKISAELAKYLLNKAIEEVFVVSNPRTAELVKLMELSQRATLIAHFFEMIKIAEAYGIDINEAAEAANTKWNFMTVYPSCGVGGYCVTPSVKSLVNALDAKSLDSGFLKSTINVMDEIPSRLAKKVLSKLENAGKNIKNCKIGIIGITYKPNIKDSRASKVKDFVNELKKNGAEKIVAYDPICEDGVKWVDVIKNLDDILDSECFVIAVAHEEFKRDDFKTKLLEAVNKNNAIILDVRNIFADAEYPFVFGISE